MKKATCTWGDGPDVLLHFENDHCVIYDETIDFSRFKHGSFTKGSMSLTADEALDLAKQLETAAHQVQDLEQSAQDYFNQQVLDEPIPRQIQIRKK